MSRRNSPDSEEEEPVLRTPPGAAPRALRTDKFEAFSVQAKAAFVPPPQESAPKIEPLPPQLAPPAPRDWDFAMPEGRAVEPDGNSSFLDPDANRRNSTAAVRWPQEDLVPSEAKEKFNDNWQRLVAEPKLKRRPRPGRPWYRSTDGRFRYKLFAKPALFLVLGIITLIVARKVTAPPKHPPAPPPPPSAEAKKPPRQGS